MSTSFGKWYEEKKNDDSDTGEASSTATGGSNNNNNWLFGGFEESMQFLPTLSTEALMNGTNIPNIDLKNFTFANMVASMEQQMPKKNISILFFALAFFVGIPMITIRPQKFALSFTCGSITFMSSFAIMKGPYEHFSSLFKAERMIFTFIYFGSMFVTIYCTFSFSGVSGYILVMSTSAIQLLSLLWYLISFLPGGTTGLRYLVAVMYQLLRPVFIVCAKWQAYCMGACLSWMTGLRRSG